MLRKKEIIGARDLVYTAAAHKCVCIPVEGSPLSILNSAVSQTFMPVTDDALVEPNSLSAEEKSLYMASIQPDVNGYERHSVEMADITRHVSKLVANSLNYARNVVNPMVVEILGQVEEAKLQVGGSIMSESITSISIAAPYNEGMLNSLVERNTLLATTSKPIPRDLADTLFLDMSADVFISVIATGSDTMDNKIRELLAGLEKQSTDYLYSGNCCSDTVNGNIGATVYTDHVPLLSYLFLLGVNAGRLENLDMDALSNGDSLVISEAINYFGYHINQRLRIMDRDIVEGTLILQNEYGNGYGVSVLASSYDGWLSGNGSNAALLGFMSLSKNRVPNPRRQRVLYDDPTQFENIYNRLLRNTQAENRVRMNDRVDTIIRQELYKFIADEYSEDASARSGMQGRVEAAIIDNPYNHAIDIDMHVLRLTCMTIANDKNDAFQILSTMRGYLMDNPDAEPGTAALVAATRLIGKWIGSQIRVAS